MKKLFDIIIANGTGNARIIYTIKATESEKNQLIRLLNVVQNGDVYPDCFTSDDSGYFRAKLNGEFD